MDGNTTSNTTKIRGYILTRMKLGLGARNIYNEVCGAYGCNEVSYRSVVRWICQLQSGLELIKDSPRSGRKISNYSEKTPQKPNIPYCTRCTIYSERYGSVRCDFVRVSTNHSENNSESTATNSQVDTLFTNR